MLNGIIFLVARAQEIFGGNLLWDVASQEILWIRSLSSNKIFNENPDENTLEYLAFGKGFIMDRIGDALN